MNSVALFGLNINNSYLIIEFRDLKDISILFEVIAIFIFKSYHRPLCASQYFKSKYEIFIYLAV